MAMTCALTTLLALLATAASQEGPESFLSVKSSSTPMDVLGSVAFYENLPSVNLSCLGDFWTQHYSCSTGIWVHYSMENYDGMFRLLNDRACIELEARVPKSFRMASHPTNRTAPSLALYSGRSFRGEEFKLYESAEDINFPFESLVIVAYRGISAKLYNEPGFTGNSTCVQTLPDGTPIPFGSYTPINGTAVRSIEFVNMC